MPILNFRAEGKTQEGEVVSAPELLVNMGPLVPVTLNLPDEVQRTYIERGEQPPAPVRGFALIDTGASATCFDIDTAQNVGLPTVGVAQMTSASHANQTVPTFAGKIVCPTITINVNLGMGANLSSVSNDMIAILGRDILKSAILNYNGPDGHFSLAM